MTVLVFTGTIFLSASLLFLIQPMYAKMLVPLLGGAPAVWNIAMVFYQAALLLGYAYAHWVATSMPTRRQVALHSIVLLAPIVMLPVAGPTDAAPPTEGSPIPWLLMTMLSAISLPFFVVSTTSPLLQRWFSLTQHKDSRDPYFLYAASNVGSFLALLGYPLIIEPRFSLIAQGQLWMFGYLVLVALVVLCGYMAWRRPATKDESSAADEPEEEITKGRKIRWVLLAFMPASLLLSVTNFITTDLLSMPLLWVIPLSLYLLSFSFVFAKKPLVPQSVWRWLGPVMIVVLMVVVADGLHRPAMLMMVLHLVAFLVISMFCHGEIATDCPPARHLTQFFLLIAIGGVLGGMFNALMSPNLFTDLHEYPLTLILAGFLLPTAYAVSRSRSEDNRDLIWPAIAAGAMLTIYYFVPEERPPANLIGMEVSMRTLKEIALFLTPSLIAVCSIKRPVRFGWTLTVIFLVALLLWRSDPGIIWRSRSFFGIVKVRQDARGLGRTMQHGTTIHGHQRLDEPFNRMPTAYYDRKGPLGDIFFYFPNFESAAIGVVGLGVGTVAAYGTTGQPMTFYEIDPDVLRVARDSGRFTYMQDSAADLDVILGDGRLSLSKETRKFDLLILDAYSSDSVPIHLLTKQAAELYRERLNEGGWIVFHISSSFFEFEPVVALLAESLGMVCIVGRDAKNVEPGSTPGKLESTWAVLMPDDRLTGEFFRRPIWGYAKKRAGVTLWTDDYSSVLQVLNIK